MKIEQASDGAGPDVQSLGGDGGTVCQIAESWEGKDASPATISAILAAAFG
jgi:hypothetical protein